MPKKSAQDWASLWDSLTASDAERTQVMLAEYLLDSRKWENNSGVRWFAGRQSVHTRVEEVTSALDKVKSNTPDGIQPSVEAMLAYVKQQISHYKPYSIINSGAKRTYDRVLGDNGFYTAHHNLSHSTDHNEYNGQLIAYDRYKIKKDRFFIRFYESRTAFCYTVITPQGQCVTDTISKDQLHQEPNIVQHRFKFKIQSGYFSPNEDVSEYLTSLFAITSKRGHTRGPHIQETDDLINILELIKRKTNIDYFSLDHNEILERYHRLGTTQDITSTSSWKKQGDYTQNMSKPDGLLIRQQHYTNMTTSTISMIQLSGYSDGRFSLRVGTRNNETFTQINVACSIAQLPEPIACIAKKIEPYRVPNEKNCWCYTGEYKEEHHTDFVLEYVDANGIYNSNCIDARELVGNRGSNITYRNLTNAQVRKIFATYTHGPAAVGTPFLNHGVMEYTLFIKCSSEFVKIQSLLDIIVSVDPGTCDVVNDISSMLGIYRSNKTQGIQRLIAHAKTAQDNNDYATIWKLAQSYRDDYFSGNVAEDTTGEELIELFEAISTVNPHYKDAQFELVGIKSQAVLNGTNNRDVLAEQYKNAINSGHQELSDQLYNSLRAGKWLCPTIRGIKPDVDSLIVLADETLQLNDQIAQLQKKIDLMNQELNPPEPKHLASKGFSSSFFNPLDSSVAESIPLEYRSFKGPIP